jgi:hypothetical protein
MKVTPIASNQTQVTLADGTEVLFSYQTPVAARVPGKGWIRSATKYSSTTTKHVNRWLLDNVGRLDCVPFVDQWDIDILVAF